MDVFVRHLPEHSTKNQTEKYFSAPLAECGIEVFHVEKMRDKSLAVITVLDTVAGQHFLDLYGVPQRSPGHVRARKPLIWQGKFLQCMRNRTEPTDMSLKTLAYEASLAAYKKPAKSKQQSENRDNRVTKFNITALQCGVWGYAGTQLGFMPYFTHPATGSVHFGTGQAIILLGPSESDQVRVDISYSNCENIVLGTSDDPTITFSLGRIAPKFYRISGLDVLTAQLNTMTFGTAAAKKKEIKKKRLPCIEPAHEKVAGSCFVYRLRLVERSTLGQVRKLLNHDAKMPPVVSVETRRLIPSESLGRSKERLERELSDTQRFGAKPFPLRYQLDALARNGCISPLEGLQLLPKVTQLLEEYGLDATLSALRRFRRQTPPPGPDIEAVDVTVPAMKSMLEEFAALYDPYAPDNPYELSKRHNHIKLVHKVVITPAGTYLEGPEPEPENRVLRTYASQTDSFVRVVFQEEDGGSIR
jgi:hypothetical protein